MQIWYFNHKIVPPILFVSSGRVQFIKATSLFLSLRFVCLDDPVKINQTAHSRKVKHANSEPLKQPLGLGQSVRVGTINCFLLELNTEQHPSFPGYGPKLG
jgi:hypothetical protein